MLDKIRAIPERKAFAIGMYSNIALSNFIVFDVTFFRIW